jgi:hypothetical protein
MTVIANMAKQRRPPRRADAGRHVTRAQNLEQEQTPMAAEAVAEDLTENEPPLTPARALAPANDTQAEYLVEGPETPSSTTHTEDAETDPQDEADQPEPKATLTIMPETPASNKSTENPEVDPKEYADQPKPTLTLSVRRRHASEPAHIVNAVHGLATDFSFRSGASAPKRKRSAEAVQQRYKHARIAGSTNFENKRLQKDPEEQQVTRELAESADSVQQRVTRTRTQQQVARRSPRIRIKLAKQNPATTFETCFTQLPKELELLVWDNAAESQTTSPGRIVLLRNTKEPLPPMTPNALPACFTVSVDAYRAMSKQYKRLFVRHDLAQSTASEPLDETLATTGHWFNPDKDVLYLTPCCS